MTSRSRGGGNDVTGGAHLARRSALCKRIQALDVKLSVLVVEDRAQDAHFIARPLELLFGERARVTIAPSVEKLKAALAKPRFDIVVLDDRLDAGATADDTLPLIRAAGFRGPVFAVSGVLTHARRAELKRLGAEVILTKDELDSVALAERILNALGHDAA